MGEGNSTDGGLVIAGEGRRAHPNEQGVLGSNIDWLVFITSLVCIIGVCIPLALYPDVGKSTLNAGFEFVTRQLGIVYILVSVGALGLLLYLALGRYGHVLFGRPGDLPDYSGFSWAAMLFCGGIGGSVLFWGTLEWAYYFQAPPYGIEPMSSAALTWAGSYPLFHWGFIGWALYTLPALPLAYVYHTLGASRLQLSAACEPLLGQYARGFVGRVIDLTFVVSLVGAAATGIGLTVPLLVAGLHALFGWQESFALQAFVILLITSLFAASVYAGLDNGIKRLSNVNAVMAFALLAFVLIVGPTLFLLEYSFESVGHMLQNFVRMSTWTDAFATSDFVEAWTVFYWAWWLALAPGMGVFIARISRGRTIRQVVFGALGYGTAGSALFFVILGGYATWLQVNGQLDVLDLMSAAGPPATVVAVLLELPMGSVLIPVFCVLCLIFAATSYDSASYSLASTTTRQLPSGAHPARWNRMFWAFFLGALPITLLYMGDLRSLQSAVVASSLPVMVVVALMTAALMRALSEARRSQ